MGILISREWPGVGEIIKKLVMNKHDKVKKHSSIRFIDYLVAKREIKLLLKNCAYSVLYVFRRITSRKIELTNNILFVCKGNICRSAFAEYRFKMIVQENRDHLIIRSCGLEANPSGQSPNDALTVAGEYGVELTNHVPKPVTSSYVDDADILLAMEYRQLKEIKKKYPMHKEKIRLLREFAPFPHNLLVNIDDPYGWDIPAFRKSFAMIDKSLLGLIKRTKE